MKKILMALLLIGATLTATTPANAFWGFGGDYEGCRADAAKMPTQYGVSVALYDCAQKFPETVAEIERQAAEAKRVAAEEKRLAAEAEKQAKIAKCTVDHVKRLTAYEDYITKKKAERHTETPEQRAARHLRKKYWTDEYKIAQRNHKTETDALIAEERAPLSNCDYWPADCGPKRLSNDVDSKYYEAFYYPVYTVIDYGVGPNRCK